MKQDNKFWWRLQAGTSLCQIWHQSYNNRRKPTAITTVAKNTQTATSEKYEHRLSTNLYLAAAISKQRTRSEIQHFIKYCVKIPKVFFCDGKYLISNVLPTASANQPSVLPTNNVNDLISNST